MKSSQLKISPTPLQRRVTVEDLSSGTSATLQSDGRVEVAILDQVALGDQHGRDFQESLDTVAIKGLLHRLKGETPKSLDDESLTALSQKTLGESWSGEDFGSKADGRVRVHFRSGNQTLSIQPQGREHSLSLVTWSRDTEGKDWMQTLVGPLDSEFRLQPEHVMEQALITV